MSSVTFLLIDETPNVFAAIDLSNTINITVTFLPF